MSTGENNAYWKGSLNELSFNAFEGKGTESPSPSKVSPSFFLFSSSFLSVSLGSQESSVFLCHFLVLLLFHPTLNPILPRGLQKSRKLPAFNSKSESNFSDVGKTLTKKRSGLKTIIVNDLLFVRSNQDLM